MVLKGPAPPSVVAFLCTGQCTNFESARASGRARVKIPNHQPAHQFYTYTLSMYITYTFLAFVRFTLGCYVYLLLQLHSR